MAEIEMPPQYADGDYPDPKDTEGKVLAALQTLAHDRVTMWSTFVLDAISEFETAANNHIEQLQYDHDATYDFNPVIAGFAEAVVERVPFTKEGAAAIEPIMEGMRSAYEKNLADAMSDAKRKLHGSVTALVQAAESR